MKLLKCTRPTWDLGCSTMMVSAVADLEIRKGGSATGTRNALKKFWVATPTSGHIKAFMTHDYCHY